MLAEIEDEGLVRNAAERGRQLREAIAAIDSALVDGCRGQGLLIGVGLRHPVAKAVVAAAQEHGLIINAPNDETIRLVPALNIGDVEIDEFIAAVHRVAAHRRGRARRSTDRGGHRMTRHLLRDDDLTAAEQAEILDLAVALKKDRWKLKPLAGPQTVAVIFDKSSTRTRVSFAVGIADLGGSPLIISTANSQLGGKETPSDTARVLERQVAAIVWRTYAQAGLEEMAAGTRVPGRQRAQRRLPPVPAARRPAHDPGAQGRAARPHARVLRRRPSRTWPTRTCSPCVTAGMHVRVASPESYAPREDVVADADRRAAETGGSLTLYTDANEAAAGADVIVTDTWVSMGKEEEKLARLRDLGEYKVTPRADDPRQARRDLHPLPARRSRLRSRGRGHRRSAERRVGRGREPTARAEGAAGVAASPGAERRRSAARIRGLARHPAGQRLNGPQRIAGVDLARGLAVIGMIAAHLLWIEDFDFADAATWVAVVDGRSSILFATLAGVSIGLVTGGSRPLAAAGDARGARSASPCARACSGSSGSC